MTRKTFLKHLLAVPAAALLPACQTSRSKPPQQRPDSIRVHPAVGDFQKLEWPTARWKDVLTADEFHILFEEGTEPRYSSALLKEEDKGTFICAACRLPLFTSVSKFHSGTGWPSFWAPIEGRLGRKRDMKLGYPRTEYHCIRCGGHQGHVFEWSGSPEVPTGLRYCNNGLALNFVPVDQPLPPLRTG